MATSDDIDFGWDPIPEVSSTPISSVEFDTLSLNDRAKKTQYTSFDLNDWFSGPRPRTNALLFAEADTTSNTNLQGKPTPLSNDNDKAYVEPYMDELEAVIHKISNDPRAQSDLLVGTIATQGTMWIDDPVYESFDMETRNINSSALAIFQHKNEVLDSLRDHQVIIVEGFTGSGKTTQIPQFILDDFAYRGKLVNIVVTQPRRIAAQSIADRVCKERRWNVGDLVGFQVGLNKRSSEKTRLTYVTTGVLLQTLISKKSLRDFTHIIVDEVHERDLDTDLLILVIKKLLVETSDTTTKIILMSATLNAEKFGDYFPKWIRGDGRINSKIIRVPQTTFYKVHEHYIDTLGESLGHDFEQDVKQCAFVQDVTNEAIIHSTMYELTVKLLGGLDQFERCGGSSSDRGGVLVFLPGLLEIDTMYKKCIEYLEQNTREGNHDYLKWTLLPLHSTITTEEQQKVFHPSQAGYRKIILATNIAESSITVTDINYVIDFCLTKSMSCDPQTNYSCLRLEWASQDQCVQRRGRVGRVSEGHVFRMLTKKAYRSLRKETVPDMEKACLENVILSVKSLDLGSPTSVMALAIDPPRLSAIKLAICNLKEVGALTIEVDGVYKDCDGDLTMMGNLMAKLPFDIRFSRLIALGNVFGVLEETVIIAAGLSVKSAFSFPFSQRLLAYLSKLKWSNGNFSDCFAIVNLYRTWKSKTTEGDMREYDTLRRWKQAYFVQTNVLREMNLCIQDVIRRLRGSDIHVDPVKVTERKMSSEQGLMLKIVLAGAFYPNYFVRFRPERTQYTRQITRELNASDPLVTLVYTGFPNEQPGNLYTTHIARKYEGANSAPYVSINGGKSVVRFDQRGAKVGQLSLNLFQGVKMRQLRHQLQFRGIRSDTARTVCEEEKAYVNTKIFLTPIQCVLPGISENFLLVSVSKVITPDNFWVIYYQELETVGVISKALQDCIQGCQPLKAADVVPGTMCIVMGPSAFCRARVEYVSTENMHIMLFLIDMGDTVWKQPRECYAFSEDLIYRRIHQYPALAIHCRIFGIKPLVRYSGTWSDEASELMSNVFGGNCNALVMDVHSVVNGVIACDLFGRRAEGHGKDEGIRARLLEDGLATEMEESTPSIENQNLRRNVNVVKFSPDEIELHNKHQRNDTAPPILLKAPGGKSCIQSYVLKGPFSPLEMTFRALSSSTHTKGVTIEGCSINSVALDQFPSLPTAIVVVAAGVGISQRSGSVILRETTLMPPIPGLVAMFTMMFCPRMQLRAEANLPRYTGCLSGLGKDYVTGQPVYGDHDMEVTFDTMFDEADIHTINGIRETMNMVLNGAHQDFRRVNVQKLRLDVRKEVTRLLERSRVPVEEVYPQKEFVWCDDPNYQLSTANRRSPLGERRMNMGRKRHRRNEVFPLHSTVVLQTPKTAQELEREARDAAEREFLEC